MSSRQNVRGKLVDDFGTIIPPTSEQMALAERYVTARAVGDDDQRMLLAMLGIGDAA